MADRKISDLTALTAQASGDLLPIVDVSEAAAADKNKSITIQELFRGIPVNVGVGTTSPDDVLDVRSGAAGFSQFVHTSGQGGIRIAGVGASSSANLVFSNNHTAGITDEFTIQMDGATDDLLFISGGTGGTEVCRMTEEGRVGIGTSSPSDVLHVVGDGGASDNSATSLAESASKAKIRFQSRTGSSLSEFQGTVNSGDTWYSQIANNSGTSSYNQVFNPFGGNVGIGTTSPSRNLDIAAGQANVGITSNTTSAGNEPTLVFTHAGNNGYVIKGGSNLQFASDSGTNVRMTLTTAGSLGIGTTSPAFSNGDGLEIARSGTACLRVEGDSGNKAAEIYVDSTGTTIDSRGTSPRTNFAIGGNSKMLLDDSGRLLVGTTTSSASGTIFAQGNSSSSTGPASLFLAKGDNAPSNGATIGLLRFSGNTHVHSAEVAAFRDGGTWTAGSSLPTGLYFSTTADGSSSPTERMRIGSDGRILSFSDSGSDAIVAGTATSASTTSYLFVGVHSRTSTVAGGTVSFYVRTNGDVRNTNNSYGAISDIKLKENIVDASSQWNDLKAIQVRNYNFKEGQTHTQIGVVAQEVELVSPGLVTESPDRDEDGNDLGTTTKSVNYSVLYMKAVKALQEAMERIETLETKVAALEAN